MPATCRPGRVVGNNKILVVCEAQAFNSGMGPVTPPLPALTNLDGKAPGRSTSSFGLGTGRYDIIGFRFNVDWVIAGLKQALIDDGTYLGGISAEEWLNDGHPCVKVSDPGRRARGSLYDRPQCAADLRLQSAHRAPCRPAQPGAVPSSRR